MNSSGFIHYTAPIAVQENMDVKTVKDVKCELKGPAHSKMKNLYFLAHWSSEVHDHWSSEVHDPHWTSFFCKFLQNGASHDT